MRQLLIIARGAHITGQDAPTVPHSNVDCLPQDVQVLRAKMLHALGLRVRLRRGS